MPRNPSKKDYSGGLPVGFERFIVIEDPRVGGNKKHHFGEILFIAVSALVCGVSSFSGMVEFAHIHEKWLRKWIGLPNGIPVKQTVINLFSLMDSQQFGQCVVEHIKDLHPELARQLIAIDGKTIRGSGKSNSDQEHCLSAWAADAGVTLALEFVRRKSNEIPSIPLLLEKLELKGHVVSMDAMGTQTAIARKIRDKGADYIMALKRNQGGLHDEAIDQFHFASRQIVREESEAWSLHERTEKANGRVCTRRVAVTNSLDWMLPSIRKKWSGLHSLVMVESETYRLSDKRTTRQKRFYISSLDADAEAFQDLIRKHWSIENGCHWVLDTLYREDLSQVRVKNAVRNFAVLRRMAHNILKSDETIKKSLPMKQMRAMADDDYRNNLLSLAG
jgi:predicted transposase YbfD/YdcC